MFVYGGRAQDATKSLAQASVFVLSLPSFTWVKEDLDLTTARFLHSCNIIGTGKSQMIVIGGAVNTLTAYQPAANPNLALVDFSIPDVWP